MACLSNVKFTASSGQSLLLDATFRTDEIGAPLKATMTPIPRAHGDRVSAPHYWGSRTLNFKGAIGGENGDTISQFLRRLRDFWALVGDDDEVTITFPNGWLVRGFLTKLSSAWIEGFPDLRAWSIDLALADPFAYEDPAAVTSLTAGGIALLANVDSDVNSYDYEVAFQLVDPSVSLLSIQFAAGGPGLALNHLPANTTITLAGRGRDIIVGGASSLSYYAGGSFPFMLPRNPNLLTFKDAFNVTLNPVAGTRIQIVSSTFRAASKFFDQMDSAFAPPPYSVPGPDVFRLDQSTIDGPDVIP